MCWLGDSDKLVTTGFSRMSDRQIAIFDYKDLAAPLKTENLDTSSGLLMPFYDNDTKMLYVAGKVCTSCMTHPRRCYTTWFSDTDPHGLVLVG